MPKRQPTRARKARARQAATGESYTKALRAPADGPTAEEGPRVTAPAALAAALHAIGEDDAADRLDRNARIVRESAPLLDAHDRASKAHWYAQGDPAIPKAVVEQLAAADWAAESAYEDAYSAHQPLAPYYAAYVALCRAGERSDGHRLARAAAEVLRNIGRHDGYFYASDEIRGYFGEGWPWQEAMRDLTGPDDPQARAARQAAQCLYEARHTKSRGDEDYLAAARLIAKAAELAHLAATPPARQPDRLGG